MIQILNKKDCVGCSACVERCPVQCISFDIDKQGFKYPKVDTSRCIDCSLCERVCPVINQGSENDPIFVYGATNPDEEIVRSSSSGGIFFAIASTVINQGGVVFGARFNEDYSVVHSFALTIDELHKFQGSKYVQSDIGDSYKQAENFLKQGKRVLFSGTPCQIAGLSHFLRKDYGDQLIKVDVICHGVPSPLVWENYISQCIGNTQNIRRISFRDKRNGWSTYGLSYCIENKDRYESLLQNIYLQGFLRDLTLRPSCFDCPSKGGRSRSDITLGDFWRVESLEPQIHFNTGTSLILINSAKGLDIIKSLHLNLCPTTYSKALISNPSYKRSTHKPKFYDAFWNAFIDNCQMSVLAEFIKKSRGSLFSRICRLLKKNLKFN